MTAISQLTRYFNKSRVFLNAANLTAPPYGGTELGATKDIFVYPGTTGLPVWDHVAGAVSDVISIASRYGPMVQLNFRQWDDAIVAAWAPSSSGSSYRHSRPGLLGTPRVLLLASEDTDGLFASFPAALVDPEETAKVAFSLAEEASLPVVIRGSRGTSGIPLYVGLSEDIALT